MTWDDRLDDWENTLDLAASLDDSQWVTLDHAARETGASRGALRTWYRNGEIPSRLAEGPHGPQRLVPLGLVAARAEASPRLRHAAARKLDAEAQLELMRDRVDRLESRLDALEQRDHSA
ncbi:MAG: excisionase [Acidothermaceae bacterium]